MVDLTDKRFNDDQAAREYLESIRWPDGPICPHCGSDERIMALKGKTTRPGLYKCGECRKQFSVTVGTVFERSKIPIHKWVLATTLMCSSKKGISAHQLHRTLNITYKSAWFMMHRIREAMREGGNGLLGGSGKTVEADETFVGGKPRKRSPSWSTDGRRRGRGTKKTPVVALVEREGRVHAQAVPSVTAKSLKTALNEHVDRQSKLMTDELILYKNAGKDYASHDTVTHSAGEYARGDIHTNTVEGYFSILKRGINGIYQHCSKEHLPRYLDEYSFRYNYRAKLGFDDEARTRQALSGISGKRLTYNPINAE